MVTISLISVVHNEETRIASFLLSHSQFFDEVIVLDQASTDNTAGIIKRFPNVNYITTDHWGFSEPSKNLAAFMSNCEWCLYLDADEELTESFLLQMDKLDYINKDGYRLMRENVVQETDFPSTFCNPIRLFRRGMAHCYPALHNDYVCRYEDRVGDVDGTCIMHYKSHNEWYSDHTRYIDLVKRYGETPFIRQQIRDMYR